MDDIDNDIARAKIGKRDESLHHSTPVPKKEPIGVNYPPMPVKRLRKCRRCGKRKPIQEFQKEFSACIFDDCIECREIQSGFKVKRSEEHQKILEQHKEFHKNLDKECNVKPLCHHCDTNTCAYRKENFESLSDESKEKKSNLYTDSIHCPFV